MTPRKQASSVPNDAGRPDLTASPKDFLKTSEPNDALALAEEAEAAEAEADAADAAAAAANARVRALKLRRKAEVAAAVTVSVPTDLASQVNGSEARVTETDERAVDTASLDHDHGQTPVDTAELRGTPRRLRLEAPRIRLQWVAVAFVVLCTLGFLGASGYMIWHHRQVTTEQQRTAEFAAAARQGVVTLMSLNFNTAQDDVKRIIDDTTGDFRRDFEGQAEDFTELAQTSKVITEAKANAAAVQSMTEDTATVLVAVTTQVSNAASEQQQPRSWRLRVNLARDGGQLKLAKVEFVP